MFLSELYFESLANLSVVWSTGRIWGACVGLCSVSYMKYEKNIFSSMFLFWMLHFVESVVNLEHLLEFCSGSSLRSVPTVIYPKRRQWNSTRIYSDSHSAVFCWRRSLLLFPFSLCLIEVGLMNHIVKQRQTSAHRGRRAQAQGLHSCYSSFWIFCFSGFSVLRMWHSMILCQFIWSSLDRNSVGSFEIQFVLFDLIFYATRDATASVLGGQKVFETDLQCTICFLQISLCCRDVTDFY